MFPQFKEFFLSSIHIFAYIIMLIGGWIFLFFWLKKRKKKRNSRM